MRCDIGLTGSIGMGKTTTASIFAKEGCAVWDADATVHELYGPGGQAVEPVSKRYPQAIYQGSVSRQRLKDLVAQDKSVLAALEAIIHPLVAQDRAQFRLQHPDEIRVFDIPLLFESGADREMDYSVVVSADKKVQMERLRARRTMTDAMIETVMAKQMSDQDKRQRADFVILTETLDSAERQVRDILGQIKGQSQYA